MANIYRVDFEVVNLTGKAGAKCAYRSGRRQALVSATTQAGVQAVLNADVAVGAGESIEVLAVQQIDAKDGQAFYS